jgi:hypothetical protein
MPHRHKRSVSPMNRSSKSPYQKLVGKELDLLLLAGCSCLLTVLYHPVSEALQISHSVNSSQPAAITQINTTSSNQSGPIHTTLPPKRENIKREEDDEVSPS